MKVYQVRLMALDTNGPLQLEMPELNHPTTKPASPLSSSSSANSNTHSEFAHAQVLESSSVHLFSSHSYKYVPSSMVRSSFKIRSRFHYLRAHCLSTTAFLMFYWNDFLTTFPGSNDSRLFFVEHSGDSLKSYIVFVLKPLFWFHSSLEIEARSLHKALLTPQAFVTSSLPQPCPHISNCACFLSPP